MSREDYLLLMLADSALPTGGFVASSGLEAATKIGLVRDVPQLLSYIQISLENMRTSTFPCITSLLDKLSAVDLNIETRGNFLFTR
jgi:urease accessory protein